MSIFDTVISRQNTNSFKWDSDSDKEILPMPVADMDFLCPPSILDAFKKVTNQGIMGYAIAPKGLNQVIVERMWNLYQWKIEEDWLVWLPGLVPALTNSCYAFCSKGDSVMTHFPIYAPFYEAPEWTNRELQVSFLQKKGNRWELNFDEISTKISSKTKLFLLCNPHNPTGTVFQKSELEQLVTICLEKNIVICSDEIHCDLVLDSTKKHLPIASLSKEAEQISVTLMAPSKTFNIPGLGSSFAIIPNKDLRVKFNASKQGMMPNRLSNYAYEATFAAYTEGESWRLELVDYLKKNHDFLFSFINSTEKLSMNPMEATYLAWINYSESGLEDFTKKLLINKLRVIDGLIFGQEGYFRLNFGCPKSVLEKGIQLIERTLKN